MNVSRAQASTSGSTLPHRREVGGRRDLRVAGPVQHLRQFRGQGPDGPADRIAVGDRVHAVQLAHAALGARLAQHRRRGDMQIGVFRAVDVASLDVEAVEAQQRGLPAVDIRRDVDGDTLVRVILDVAVPQLVPDDEGQRRGGKSGALGCLCHVWTLLPASIVSSRRSCPSLIWIKPGNAPVGRAANGGSPASLAGGALVWWHSPPPDPVPQGKGEEPHRR